VAKAEQVTREQEAAIRRRQMVRLTLLAPIVVAAAAVALDNRQDVVLGYGSGNGQLH